MTRRVGILSALVIALALSSSVATPARGTWPPPAATGGPALQPFLMRHDGTGAFLTPIEPETLADAGEPIELRLPGIEYAEAWWCMSGNRTTLATVEGDGVAVRDAASLSLRHRFPLGWAPYWCAISDDGGRLVVAALLDRQLSGSAISWQTYDLRSGDQVSTIAGTHAGDLQYWIDPTAHLLYQLAWEYPSGPGDAGPKHPTLVAYDLDSGKARARLELPEVVAGGWWESPEGGQETDGFPVMYSPAGLLLPDGKRFVVVHVGFDALTMVDTETMSVERTVALARPTGRLDGLLGLLGLAPQPAAAAAAEGASLIVALHPDGRHLYVSGNVWEPAESGYRSTGVGLYRIDLERGEIVAELPEGAGFHELEPSSDGRYLYAIGPRPGDTTGSSLEVNRLDATTLETLATRELALGGTLDLLPDPVLAAVDAAATRS